MPKRRKRQAGGTFATPCKCAPSIADREKVKNARNEADKLRGEAIAYELDLHRLTMNAIHTTNDITRLNTANAELKQEIDNLKQKKSTL